MADIDTRILARELGKLGGIGARLVARFLPSVSHESTFLVNASTGYVGQRIDEFLKESGKPIQEFPSNPDEGRYSAIVGSGLKNLNPTILHLQLGGSTGAVSVLVRAIAKEGKVGQQTAQRLVERVELLLKQSV